MKGFEDTGRWVDYCEYGPKMATRGRKVRLAGWSAEVKGFILCAHSGSVKGAFVYMILFIHVADD